jgi:inosose dehydratase
MKKEQLFSIGYHLNSWDLAGLPIKPALEFLKGQGFEWFEILAWNSLSDVFARKYMDLGPQEPAEVITDTTFLRRMATLSQGAAGTGHPTLLALLQRHLHRSEDVAVGA